MAKKTSKLKLTLPEKNEFQNSWHSPLNNNFETIDEYVTDLRKSLVDGSAGTDDFAELRGSTASLADRLDVSLNADGTIKVAGTPDIVNMANSPVYGDYTTPHERLEQVDHEAFAARSPVPYGRFVPVPTTGHNLAVDGYLPSDVDSSIALRSEEKFRQGWVSGASPLLQAVGTNQGQVQINAGATGAIFNIDGFAFHLREDLVVDFNGATPAGSEYFWVYVERNEAAYAETTMTYKPLASGALAPGDMRKVYAPALSLSTSGNIATVAGADFTAGQFVTRPGDLLVIATGTATGKYVIESVTTTQVTIKGLFKADVIVSDPNGWYIYNSSIPKVGLAKASSNPTLITSQPPVVNGRSYIGRVKFNSLAAVDEVVTFAKNGSYDSGWITATLPAAIQHDLGTIPSRVEVWFRASATGLAYRGIVKRQVVTSGGPPTDLLFPSNYYSSSDVEINVYLLNASTDPIKPTALYTDSGGVDVTAGEMRILAWR